MRTISDLCVPRDDVRKGTVRESDFAADLAQVLVGKAPREYLDPAVFFAHTHPTKGLCRLIDNVSRRLRALGDAPAVFRLDTQYGGSKTHALIALAHLAKGAQAVPNLAQSSWPPRCLAQHQSLRRQVRLDLVEQHQAERMALEQMEEVQDRRLIALARERQPGEPRGF